jgi:hypothetical protein
MSGGFFLVVGDVYESFANNENVITATAFMRALQDQSRWFGDERIMIGQGLGANELHQIRELLHCRAISNVTHCGDLVPLHLTHKRNTDHVLISSPKKIAPHRYEYGLALNDRKDRLCDHVTGQHIGAMQLMEAARQAMIATLEYEYVDGTGKRIGLILERFDSRFENYVFPLPASMSVNIVERKTVNDNHLSVTIVIRIIQAGQAMCQMELDLTLYDMSLLGKIEARRAKRAVATLMQMCPEQQVVSAEAI